MKTIRKKFYDTIKPTWDFRFILLFVPWVSYNLWRDSSGTEGVLIFCSIVLAVWGVSLLISKVLMPGAESTELTRMACETPIGAAIVYFANRLLLIAIGLSFILWWVRP